MGQYDMTSKGQAARTIAQLIQYNTFVRLRDGDVKRDHAKARSRDLVEILHALGVQ